MKKTFLAGLLVVVMCVTFCGCGEVKPQEIKLNRENITVTNGESFELTAEILPAEAEDKSVTWRIFSDDDNVYKPSTGNNLTQSFTAKKSGKAIIKAITYNGFIAECSVTIQESEEERIARKKREEEARIAAEKAAEEEKLSYETGITFDQLSRNPYRYKYEKVKFTGKVIQVIEGSGITGLRMNVTNVAYGRWKDTILVHYAPSIVSSRVLEDDIITIYGVSQGLHTYKATNGQSITLPLIEIDKIEQ